MSRCITTVQPGEWVKLTGRAWSNVTQQQYHEVTEVIDRRMSDKSDFKYVEVHLRDLQVGWCLWNQAEYEASIATHYNTPLGKILRGV